MSGIVCAHQVSGDNSQEMQCLQLTVSRYSGLESNQELLLRLPGFQRTFLRPLVEFFECLLPARSLLLLLIVTTFPTQNSKRDYTALITPAQCLKSSYSTNLSLKIS